MTSPVYFTVEADFKAFIEDASSDSDYDPQVVPISATVTFTPLINAGDVVLATNASPRPTGFIPAPITAIIDPADGRLKMRTGTDAGSLTGFTFAPVRLLGSSALLELDGPLEYSVRFSEVVFSNGRRGTIASFNFEAPSSDIVLNLIEVARVPGQVQSGITKIAPGAVRLVDGNKAQFSFGGVDIPEAVQLAPIYDRFTAAVGDGAATSFTLSHDLNTRAVAVSVWNTSTWEEVEADVSLPSVNTVTVGFGTAPTLNQYTVSVVASGGVGATGPAGGPTGATGPVGASGPPGPTGGVGGIVATGLDNTGVVDAQPILQAYINAASPGDTIYLLGGSFRLNAPLVINKPLVIRGGGGMFTAANQGGTWPGVAGTTLTVSSATNNGLSITSSGVVLEDFAVVNTRALASPPTAGVGIHMNNANNFRLSRLTVAGFYDCVRLEGRFGAMDSCNIFDPVRYGIHMFNDNAGEYDFGDQGISNCVIAMYGRKTDAQAAVRWDSGGGIRWDGNKIVAGTGPGASNIGYFRYGIDIMAADNMRSVEFMISGGGISTCADACIRLGQQNAGGTQGFGDLTVTGVVFQGNNDNSVEGLSKAILIGAVAPANSLSIAHAVITGNTFKSTTAGGIVAYNMQGLIVGPNVWSRNGGSAYTGALITLAGSSAAGADDGVGTRQVDIARQTVVQSSQTQNITMVHDKRLASASPTLDGFVDYRYKRTFYSNSADWVTYFTVEPPDAGGAGFIDVVLAAAEYTPAVANGPFYVRKIRRSFLKNNTTVGGAITVATVGTDEDVNTTAYVGLRVVDGGSGKLLVQGSLLPGGTYTAAWGDIEINVTGRVQKFSYGTGSIEPGS